MLKNDMQSPEHKEFLLFLTLRQLGICCQLQAPEREVHETRAHAHMGNNRYFASTNQPSSKMPTGIKTNLWHCVSRDSRLVERD